MTQVREFSQFRIKQTKNTIKCIGNRKMIRQFLVIYSSKNDKKRVSSERFLVRETLKKNDTNTPRLPPFFFFCS